MAVSSKSERGGYEGNTQDTGAFRHGLRDIRSPVTVTARASGGSIGCMGNPFQNIFNAVVELYIWCLIVWVVLSWLVAFNVVNPRNRFVSMVGDFLDRITEPALRPIRRVLPNLGGIDISPILLILLIYFIRDFVNWYIF
jgi:YggT family protein